MSAENNQPESHSAPWLITMTDIMALMLCFFVLIYAMGDFKIEGRESEGEIQEIGEEATAALSNLAALPRSRFDKGYDLQYLAGLFEAQQKSVPELKNMSINIVNDRLVLSFPTSFLFAKNKANINETAQKTLQVLAGSVGAIKNTIQIVGHADKTAVRNVEGNANWSLSLMRAVSVAQALKNAGYEKKIVTQGRGDSMASGLAGTQQERDRRVDIIILPYDFAKPAGKGIMFVP